MLDSGDYVVPILYGRPYLNKPPGLFWAVAGIGAFRGDVDEWAVRLPSALAALGGALLVGIFARRSLPPLTRHLAALLFLSGFVTLDKGTLGEIDGPFSMLVFAALAAWWAGTGPGRPAQWGWLAAGSLLGLASLAKGPPALVLFYAPVLTFLAWERDWRRLAHPVHALGLVLAILPGFLWAWRLTAQLEWNHVVDTWVRELSRTGTAQEFLLRDHLLHLVRFPVDVLLMLLPWAPVAAIAASPRFREDKALRGPLGRWLSCVVLAPILSFWLYPDARARYVMIVSYGISILAASVGAAPAGGQPGRRVEVALRAIERVGPAVALVLGTAGLVAAEVLMPGVRVNAFVGLSVGVAASVVLYRLNRAPATASRPVSALATLAVVILLGWLQWALVVRPWLAERDPPRVAWRTVSPHLPAEQPQYARVRYHNVLFYFARDLRLLGPGEYGRLPRGVPVTLFVTRAEFDRLRTHPGFRVRELADSPPRVHKPWRTLVAAEVIREANAPDFVGDREPDDVDAGEPDASPTGADAPPDADGPPPNAPFEVAVYRPPTGRRRSSAGALIGRFPNIARARASTTLALDGTRCAGRQAPRGRGVAWNTGRRSRRPTLAHGHGHDGTEEPR
jgi:4-amino-4-deoxy-L-arabinose transferase-like glycosyltransferase